MLMILLTISIVTFFPGDRRNCLIIAWLHPVTVSLHLIGVHGKGRFLIVQNVTNVSIILPNFIQNRKKKEEESVLGTKYYKVQNSSIIQVICAHFTVRDMYVSFKRNLGE